MNEQRYNAEHLQDYTGILTSLEAQNGRFKMELKVEDNPVLKRSIEKIDSSIELEFYYNMGLSTLFFHDIHTCPLRNSQNEQCHECEEIKDIYNKFEANIYFLQIGDTFRIKASLINNKQSVLPREIQSFKNYEPLTAACVDWYLRLPDTTEGIKKKNEIEEQRLQLEEGKKTQQEEAEKTAKRRKRKESIKQYFGQRPNTNQIIVTVIGTTIANQILPLIFKWLKEIYNLFFSN